MLTLRLPPFEQKRKDNLRASLPADISEAEWKKALKKSTDADAKKRREEAGVQEQWEQHRRDYGHR